MHRFNKDNRKVVVTFIVAGIAAVFAEHALKPNLKRKFKV